MNEFPTDTSIVSNQIKERERRKMGDNERNCPAAPGGGDRLLKLPAPSILVQVMELPTSQGLWTALVCSNGQLQERATPRLRPQTR